MSSLRLSDPMYHRLLSYFYYLLSDQAQGVNAAGMVNLRTFIKSLDITVKEHHFDGTDPITLFQFLINFVTEADKRNISGAQVYLALPTYLDRRAKSQFTSMQNNIRDGEITCRPEAIQFLSRSYPTPNIIRDAVAELQITRQLSTEDESGYAGRLSTTFSRCGNVHD